MITIIKSNSLTTNSLHKVLAKPIQEIIALDLAINSLRFVSDGDDFEKYDIQFRCQTISEETGYTTTGILGELNSLVSNGLSLNFSMRYLENKYLGIRKSNLWARKRMEELYMTTGRFDAYDALCNGFNLTVLKDRTTNNFNKNSIKDVIFNNPATVVLWKDGTKTVVKCQDRDTYNPELGLAMCIIKKCCGNKGSYNDIFNKWLPKEN